MAEQEELKIVISAETVDLVKSLAQAGNALSDFGKDGKYSIDALNNALLSLRKAAVASTDVQEIKRLGKAYSELQAQASKLNDAFYGLEQGTRRSRIAVYSLNQVVRDAPFGFIAISNNIPVLIDQFQALVQEEKSVRGAFKAFGNALLGAGGISIALSAIISLVTSAVQKYGSLEKALIALRNSQYAWADSLQESNESLSKFVKNQRDITSVINESTGSIAGEIALIRSLVNVIEDENASNEKKLGAKRKLVEINKDVFGDLLKEKNALFDLTDATNRYIQSLIAQAIIKGFQDEIGKTTVELSRQKRAFDQLLTPARNAAKAYEDVKNLNDQINIIPGAVQGIGTLTTSPLQNQMKKLGAETEAATSALVTKGDEVVKLANDLRGLKGAIQETVNQFAELLGITKTSVELKSDKDAERQNAKNAKDAINNEKERQKIIEQGIKDELALLQVKLDAQKQYIDTLNILDQNYLQEKLKQLDIEFRIKTINLQNEISDKKTLNDALIALDEQRKNAIIEIENAIRAARVKANDDIEKDRAKQFRDLQKSIADENRAIQEIYRNLGQAIDSALTQSINSLFDTLENGRSVFEGIGLAVKRLVFELGAAVVKAAALAAVVSILSGGGIPFTAAFKTALGGGGLGNIFENLLPSAGFGLNAAPINGPGGFALSGQVVFVQRGADLVGVLNQTSARIGRIG